MKRILLLIIVAILSPAVCAKIAVKSNAGLIDDAYLEKMEMSRLASASSDSSQYILPVKLTGDEWRGTFAIDGGLGFSILENTRNSGSSMVLTSPEGVEINIQEGMAECAKVDCKAFLNMELVGKNPDTQIRIVSINSSQIETKGTWQITVKRPAAQYVERDYIISVEDGVVVSLYDTDQQFLSGQENEFYLEFRRLEVDYTNEKGQESTHLIPAGGIEALTTSVALYDRNQKLKTVWQERDVVRQSGENHFSIKVPPLTAGSYTLEMEVVATLTDGAVVQRTAFYAFPVEEKTAELLSADAYPMGESRLEISLNARVFSADDDYFVHAEVWDGKSPVAWISGMTYSKKSAIDHILPLVMDGRWFALAGASDLSSLELRSVTLLNPDTFTVIDRHENLPFRVSALPPSAATKKAEVIIDDAMLYGKPDVFVPEMPVEQPFMPAPPQHDNGIVLVPGWCDGSNGWNVNYFNDGPTYEYTNSDQSLSRNQFAQAIRNQADQEFNDWYSVVAHSQGGQAAVHLKAYYFSKLDSSPAERPIQSVGTPYEGSVLMNWYFAFGLGWLINEIFNISDCEPQFTLTTYSSFFWNLFLPFSAKNDTYYHVTIHKTGKWYNFWQFWRWKCNIASYFLWGRDDGVVKQSNTSLYFAGNYMGLTKGQCHTDGMRYMDQRDDTGRNDVMDEKGRVNNNPVWTSWLDRDNPSGTGDWEHRSGFAGVCSNPIDFQARTVGSNIPALSTGEVFHFYSASNGLVCRNADQQDGWCNDYEVRFLCN